MTATVPARLAPDRALEILDRAAAQSDADGVFLALEETDSALTRFAENQTIQNLAAVERVLSVTSEFGRRRATSTTSDLSPEAIADVLARSRALARVAPEDPEWVPLLEPGESVARTGVCDGETADLSPLARGERVRAVCDRAAGAGFVGSGTLSTVRTVRAIANSRGLRRADAWTRADFALTARGDTGSSWSRCTASAIADLPADERVATVLARAARAQRPRPLEPGVYPAILTPAATADLLFPWLPLQLDARAADEGRSFASQADGDGQPAGNRQGETCFSPLATLRRDPAHPLLGLPSFDGEGLPLPPLDLIRNGRLETLSYSRYWADRQGRAPTGELRGLVLAGDAARDLDALVADTERGVLICRAWYVRYVNPKTLEVTGMTRDGTFWIENGKISHPVCNLRFNQRLPEFLRDLDAVGRVERYGDAAVPAVRTRAFQFSSTTDSV